MSEKLNESCSRFNELKSRCDAKPEELERIKETLRVSHRFEQRIDSLYKFISKLPAFKMRRTPLKPPYDCAQILIKYSQIEVKKNYKNLSF